MNVSQPQQLIKSWRWSVDHTYLLAAVILWWWNRLDSWFCTAYLPLRSNIFWLRRTMGALFQLHNLEKIWEQLFITNYSMARYGNSSLAASEITRREIAFHPFSFTIQLSAGSELGQRHYACCLIGTIDKLLDLNISRSNLSQEANPAGHLMRNSLSKTQETFAVLDNCIKVSKGPAQEQLPHKCRLCFTTLNDMHNPLGVASHPVYR